MDSIYIVSIEEKEDFVMEYSVDYLPDKNIVEIKVRGRLSFQAAEKYSKEAVKLAHKNDCSKFLFNYSGTLSQKSITNFHTSGDDLQQFGFKNTDNIAIVFGKGIRKSNILEQENKNSNWSKIEYFEVNKLQDAFNWLSEIK